MGEAKRIITDLADSWPVVSGGPTERRIRREQEKPGTFIQNLPPEIRQKLRDLKSEDVADVRYPHDWQKAFDYCD